MTKHFLLYGGGLDSTALLVYLIKAQGVDPSQLELIHVNYGQKAVIPEAEAAFYFTAKYRLKVTRLTCDLGFSTSSIMCGSDLGVDKQDNRLELRNLVLISMAASYIASTNFEGDSHLYLGFHREPVDAPFPDARTEYLEPLQEALYRSTGAKVTLETPFANLTRLEILQQYLHYDEDILTRSYTCYEEVECGECVHCQEKKLLIQRLLPYPSTYQGDTQ